MAEDILDKLKAKEEEMEALINDARRRASIIKEEALKRAKELKNAKIKEADIELARIGSAEEEAIAAEIKRIEEGAAKEVEELRKKGLRNMDNAVKEVMRLIAERAF